MESIGRSWLSIITRSLLELKLGLKGRCYIMVPEGRLLLARFSGFLERARASYRRGLMCIIGRNVHFFNVNIILRAQLSLPNNGFKIFKKSHGAIVHERKKPFKCDIFDICDWLFPKTQMRKKSFKCDICGYSCSQNTQIKKHVQSVHEEKNQNLNTTSRRFWLLCCGGSEAEWMCLNEGVARFLL